LAYPNVVGVRWIIRVTAIVTSVGNRAAVVVGLIMWSRSNFAFLRKASGILFATGWLINVGAVPFKVILINRRG